MPIDALNPTVLTIMDRTTDGDGGWVAVPRGMHILDISGVENGGQIDIEISPSSTPTTGQNKSIGSEGVAVTAVKVFTAVIGQDMYVRATLSGAGASTNLTVKAHPTTLDMPRHKDRAFS